MLFDIGFFDEAAPTSTISRRRRAEAAAGAPEAADDEADLDVPDFASFVAKLKKTTSYRYVIPALHYWNCRTQRLSIMKMNHSSVIEL